ncbi:MAG: PAS domain-containing protein, partial [bacterium]
MDPDLKDYLTHHSLEGIVVTDTEGTILQCNGTAYGILGYAEGELTGEFIGGIFPPPSTAHLLPNLIRMAAREGGFDGEIMLQDSDGHPVIVRLFADPFPRESPRRIIFRFLDWTEVQLIMKQLRESSQMAVLGSLTRSMAHEILNPISVIGAYTRRLLKSLPPGSGEEEWTSQVLANVEKLESLIETVQAYLDLPSPSFSQQSPDKVLDGALDCIREEAGARGIRLLEE